MFLELKIVLARVLVLVAMAGRLGRGEGAN